MILRFSNWLLAVSVALVVTGFVLPEKVSGAEKRRGRPIEFSDGKSSDITTNISQFGRRGGLRDLEDDLTRSFHKGFSSAGSLDGVSMPVPPRQAPTPAQNKKLRELMDRKKNWAFGTPEDMFAGPTAEELLNIPEIGLDGKNKKPRSAMETYYHRLERQGKGTDKMDPDRDRDDLNLFGTKKSTEFKQTDFADDKEKKEDDSPSNLTDDERALRSMFNIKPSGAAGLFSEVNRAKVSDFFGREVVVPSAAQTEIQNSYLNKYREILGMPALPTAGTPLGNSLSGALSGINDVRPAATPLVTSLDNGAASVKTGSGFDVTIGTIGLPAAPSSPFVNSDLSSKVLSPWVAPSPTPKPDTPRIVMPTPGFEMQLRKF